MTPRAKQVPVPEPPPTVVSLLDVEAAARRLAGVVARTPLVESSHLHELTGVRVGLKCENLQRTGSFKLRGAYNFISRLLPKVVSMGLVTYSSGNHAQAVAMAARVRGAPVTVVMPETVPDVKRRGAERLGAEIVVEGTTSLERRAKAEEIAIERKMTIVPPFEHPDIVAGQGTVGLEIADSVERLDMVIVPIGGGGLAGGVAAAIKALRPEARVIGVEPEGAASMKAALKAGGPVELESIDTVADGLAPVIAGELTYLHASTLLDDIVTVSDDDILKAAAHLMACEKLVVEYSGAATVAAIMSGTVKTEDLRVVAVLSGGNIDPKAIRTLDLDI